MPDATAPRCLILGGTGVVGAAILRVLNREGCRLAFTYHSRKEAADDLRGSISQCFMFQCDLQQFDQVKETVYEAGQSLGGLDALVVAAGTSGEDRFWKCAAPGNYDKLQVIDQKAFDEMIAINTRGVLAACQAAAVLLRQSGGGNILLIRSIDGIKPVPSPIHFATSIAATKGMVEALSKELGNYNIRVNILALGILTGGASRKLSPEVTEAYLKHCSLGRLGKPEEVAEMAAWLAVENTYITGQAVLLDGGL